MEEVALQEWKSNNKKEIKALSEYYKYKGIGVGNNFSCNKCKNQTYKGSEAYIGKDYGKSNYKRVLVVSLDRGQGSKNLEDRFFNEIYGECIIKNNLNVHMKGTLEILKVVFPKLANKLQKENKINYLFNFYSMTNSAKCCHGQGMNQAPDYYYDKCQDYTKGEIEKLMPDIIIVQGKNAVRQVCGLYPKLNNDQQKWNEIFGKIKIKQKDIIVLTTWHPRYPYSKRRTKFNDWKQYISTFSYKVNNL